MTHSKQMSESMRLGIALAMSGGLMDAYSYLERDHVFANAQTGNMLLLGVNLSQGNFDSAFHYFLPVLFFALGIAVAQNLRILFGKRDFSVHWRQACVLIECLALCVVAFLPLSVTALANALTSFACGIQVQSFRKIHGNGIATTMCIGNMRSGVDNLVSFVHTGKREHLSASLISFGVILSFVIGAVIGSLLIPHLGTYSILVSSGILLAAFGVMFREPEE